MVTTKRDIQVALRQLVDAYADLGVDVGDLTVEGNAPGDGHRRYTVVNGAGQQPLGRRVYHGTGEAHAHLWTAVYALRHVVDVRRRDGLVQCKTCRGTGAHWPNVEVNLPWGQPLDPEGRPVICRAKPGQVRVGLAGVSGDFSITGGGGWGDMDFAPSIGMAAMIFHGLSVLSAGEISDPDNLINGISIPDLGTVAAILIDRFSPSIASFFVETSATPTIATIYGLSLGDPGAVTCVGDVFDNIVDSRTVRFSAPGSQVPEPTAALAFAVGFLVIQASCRRR